MRIRLFVCAGLFAAAAAAAQEPKKAGNGKPTITVTGCLDGGFLRVYESDYIGSYTERYRLHASKQLMKEITSKHNNHVIEVTGTVTDVRGNSHTGQTVQLGKKTKVYTGAKDIPRVPSGEDDPTLDVLSFVEQKANCIGKSR